MMNGVTDEEIQEWLLKKLSELLEIKSDDIDIEKPFASYGLSSTAAVSLSGELGKWLKVELSAVVLWDYPDVKSLSIHLAELIAQKEDKGNDKRVEGEGKGKFPNKIKNRKRKR